MFQNKALSLAQTGMKETQAEGIEQGKYGEEQHPQDPRSDEEVFYALLLSHGLLTLGDRKIVLSRH